MINNINTLGLYGLGQNAYGTSNYGTSNLLGSSSLLGSSLLGTNNLFGTSALGANAGVGNMFSSIFGGTSNALGGTASATNQNDLYSLENMNKAIDIDGNGQITEEEIAKFLQDPITALQKAAASNTAATGDNSAMSTILTMLKQLLTGQNETKQTANQAMQASQGNAASISNLQGQLQAAVNESNNLKNQVADQKTKVDEATKTAQDAAADAKAAADAAKAARQELVDFKNSHGDENPKLFANEFALLLDKNEDAAVTHEEFQKLAQAAGEDLKLDKTEWDALVQASDLADKNKADLQAQVAANDEIDVKGLEDKFFESDTDKDGKVEAGQEIEGFGAAVAAEGADSTAVNTGEIAKASFTVEEPAAEA